PAIVPRPAHLEVRPGTFILAPDTRVLVDDSSQSEGELLAKCLRGSTGYAIPVERSAKCQAGAINLRTGAHLQLGPEGYRLEVQPDMVLIHAPTAAGVFYGTQSLLQLLPPQIHQPPSAHE